MGAEIRVVIVEVDVSCNAASTGKIAIQTFLMHDIIDFWSCNMMFYTDVIFKGQEADHLELGEGATGLHHKHQGKHFLNLWKFFISTMMINCSHNTVMVNYLDR